MASIEFDTIYNRALSRINDLKLTSYTEEDFYEVMLEWLKSCSASPRFRKLFKTFSVDEDSEEVIFELNNSVDELYDSDFVTTLLAKGIIINYLPSRLEDTVHLATMIGGTEEKKLLDNYKNNMERLNRLSREFNREIARHSYYFSLYEYGGV